MGKVFTCLGTPLITSFDHHVVSRQQSQRVSLNERSFIALSLRLNQSQRSDSLKALQKKDRAVNVSSNYRRISIHIRHGQRRIVILEKKKITGSMIDLCGLIKICIQSGRTLLSCFNQYYLYKITSYSYKLCSVVFINLIVYLANIVPFYYLFFFLIESKEPKSPSVGVGWRYEL